MTEIDATTEELLRRARTGNTAALGELFAHYRCDAAHYYVMQFIRPAAAVCRGAESVPR